VPLLVWIIICAAIGGIASAAFAVAFLWVPPERTARILPHFLSFATGALLAAALLALLPEAVEGAGAEHARAIGACVLGGLGFFFVIEKLVLAWHHEHPEGAHGHEHGHGHAHGHDHGGHTRARDRASGILVLIGDSLHNALDGVLIAAAFLSNVPLGLLTTVAVAAHEVPHRVGDFALLVHAGFSRERALVLNLATGLASVAGAVVAYFALRATLELLPYALAVAAAGFLYIAVAGLIPGLHRSADPRTSAAQVLWLALGVGLVALAERLTHS